MTACTHAGDSAHQFHGIYSCPSDYTPVIHYCRATTTPKKALRSSSSSSTVLQKSRHEAFLLIPLTTRSLLVFNEGQVVSIVA